MQDYTDLLNIKYLLQITKKIFASWLFLTVVLLTAGLYFGLKLAPSDYQQGETYKRFLMHKKPSEQGKVKVF